MAVAVKRIRFVPEPFTGESLRRFTQPRAVAAVEESCELETLPKDHPWPETFDDLFVVVAPGRLPSNLESTIQQWLPPPDYADAPQPALVKLDPVILRWRPGRAVVECAGGAGFESVLAAIASFAFYEGELRRLEQALLPYEAAAPADAALAYRIRQSGRAEWERFGETMEALARLRLTFARLEPLLASPPRTLDLDGRRAAAGLAARSGIGARLESFSNRLEACEDLYEGAVDRITDFRWYRKGEILETTIVVLLALEAVLIAWQALGHL
jgi:hypothetical protein